MSHVNQKIMRILYKELGIRQMDIDTSTNLLSKYDLCGWELECLYAKIEQAFEIEITLPVPANHLSVDKLMNEVLSVSKRHKK